MTSSKTYRITCPDDLLAMVPAVLGFHPEESLVVLTIGQAPDPFFARVDLPSEPADVEELAAHLASVVARHALHGVALVVYSVDAATAESSAVALVRTLADAGTEVPIAVRADGGRWFRLHGGESADGDSGTPYDVTAHPFTLEAVVDGRVVHESREALADTLVTRDPDEVEAVQHALAKALRRKAAAARQPLGPPNPAGARNHLVAEGRWLQERVRQFVVDGGRLDTEEVGRLLVAVTSAEVRDVAWSEMTRADARSHVDLWRDVVRRSPRESVAAPAAMLAFAAWLSGDGALAWCAVDLSQQAEPGYGMAALVAQTLAAAVPPSTWSPLGVEALPLFAG
jgi:hypothetical protein